MKKYKIFIIILGLLFLNETGKAQQDGHQPNSIAIKLALSDIQKVQMDSISSRYRQAIMGIPGSTSTEIRKTRIENATTLYLQQVRDILTVRQYQVFIEEKEKSRKTADERFKQKQK